MAFEVIMPKAGMAMEEGTLVQWLKEEGDYVEAGESLLEIMTDKVNMEIEAEDSGYLVKILGEEGETYPVFAVVGYIGEDTEDLPEELKVPQGEEAKQAGDKISLKENQKLQLQGMSRSDESADDFPRATPSARRMADQSGISLKSVQGSGPLGRIHAEDMKKAINLLKENENTTPDQQDHEISSEIFSENLWANPITELLGEEIHKENEQKKSTKKFRYFTDEEEPMEKTQRIPLTGIRKAIAHRMKESYLTSPMYSLTIEVDMSRVKQMLEELKEPMSEERGIRLTVTDFIIKAAAKALKQFPTLNASMEQDHIVLHHHVHVALAVGLENGLLVPVIQDADKKSLAEIAMTSKDLAQRAREGYLKPWEHEGSTFTISNLGIYDIESFTAIINQPNSALLSVGAVVDKVVPKNGDIAILPMMKLTANIDHRVTDGATGAQFLQYLRDILEKPSVIFELR